MPEGQALPDLHRPVPFMSQNTDLPLRQPGIDKTGPVPVKPVMESMPVEELEQMKFRRGFAHRADIQTFFDFHKADEEAD